VRLRSGEIAEIGAEGVIESRCRFRAGTALELLRGVYDGTAALRSRLHTIGRGLPGIHHSVLCVDQSVGITQPGEAQGWRWNCVVSCENRRSENQECGEQRRYFVCHWCSSFLWLDMLDIITACTRPTVLGPRRPPMEAAVAFQSPDPQRSDVFTDSPEGSERCEQGENVRHFDNL